MQGLDIDGGEGSVESLSRCIPASVCSPSKRVPESVVVFESDDLFAPGAEVWSTLEACQTPLRGVGERCPGEASRSDSLRCAGQGKSSTGHSL
jgi:hypothetical protein